MDSEMKTYRSDLISLVEFEAGDFKRTSDSRLISRLHEMIKTLENSKEKLLIRLIDKYGIVLDISLFKYLFSSWKRKYKIKSDKSEIITDEDKNYVRIDVGYDILKNMIDAENSSYGSRFSNLLKHRNVENDWEQHVCDNDVTISIGNKEVFNLHPIILHKVIDRSFHIVVKRDTNLTFEVNSRIDFHTYEVEIVDPNFSDQKRSLSNKVEINQVRKTIKYPILRLFTFLVHLVGEEFGLIPKFTSEVNASNIYLYVKMNSDKDTNVKVYNTKSSSLSSILRGFLWIFGMNPGMLIYEPILQVIQITPYDNLETLRKNEPGKAVEDFFMYVSKSIKNSFSSKDDSKVIRNKIINHISDVIKSKHDIIIKNKLLKLDSNYLSTYQNVSDLLEKYKYKE